MTATMRLFVLCVLFYLSVGAVAQSECTTADSNAIPEFRAPTLEGQMLFLILSGEVKTGLGNYCLNNRGDLVISNKEMHAINGNIIYTKDEDLVEIDNVHTHGHCEDCKSTKLSYSPTESFMTAKCCDDCSYRAGAIASIEIDSIWKLLTSSYSDCAYEFWKIFVSVHDDMATKNYPSAITNVFSSNNPFKGKEEEKKDEKQQVVEPEDLLEYTEDEMAIEVTKFLCLEGAYSGMARERNNATKILFKQSKCTLSKTFLFGKDQSASFSARAVANICDTHAVQEDTSDEEKSLNRALKARVMSGKYMVNTGYREISYYALNKDKVPYISANYYYELVLANANCRCEKPNKFCFFLEKDKCQVHRLIKPDTQHAGLENAFDNINHAGLEYPNRMNITFGLKKNTLSKSSTSLIVGQPELSGTEQLVKSYSPYIEKSGWTEEVRQLLGQKTKDKISGLSTLRKSQRVVIIGYFKDESKVPLQLINAVAGKTWKQTCQIAAQWGKKGQQPTQAKEQKASITVKRDKVYYDPSTDPTKFMEQLQEMITSTVNKAIKVSTPKQKQQQGNKAPAANRPKQPQKQANTQGKGYYRNRDKKVEKAVRSAFGGATFKKMLEMRSEIGLKGKIDFQRLSKFFDKGKFNASGKSIQQIQTEVSIN